MPAQHWSTPMQSFGGVPMTPSTSSGGGRDVILAAASQQPQQVGMYNNNLVELSPVNAQPSSNHQDSTNLVYPALHLHPLNESFVPKQISLAPAGPTNRVKIGRQTNAKTMPHPTNGYFDSKVLSRMHAEVWSQEGKVFIKDVKSSNGTFINGERLSAEGVESDVFELHSEDMVEFGIDIVGEDNRTIIHHKVACRCYLVLTAEDALGIRSDFAALYRGGGHGGPMGGAAMGPGAEGGLRRGKSTMSFDHILSRLQSEIQRSRDNTNDLNGVQTAFAQVGETLNGGLPPMPQPPYQHMVPPHPAEAAATAAAASAAAAQSASVTALQEQLASTQASLAAHVEKIRALEGILQEHQHIKAEVGSMKAQMQQAKRDIDEMVTSRRSITTSNGGHADDQDFDDSASVASMDTVMAADTTTTTQAFTPATLTATQDEDALASLQSTALATHEGPFAPPDEPVTRDQHQGEGEAVASLALQNAQLTQRLEALEVQLEEALSLGRNLQAQHASATQAVRALEGRLASLESSLHASAQEEARQAARAGVEGATQALEGRWSQWKATLEEAWKNERKGWEQERDEMKRVVKAWDEANGRLEAEAERVLLASSSSTSSAAVVGSSSDQASTLTGATTRARRGSSKAAKRRAARRHLNASLRSLLYKSTHDVVDAGLSSDTAESDDSSVEHNDDAITTSSRRSLRQAGKAQSSSSTVTAPPAAPGADTSTHSNPASTSASGESAQYSTTPGTSPAGSVLGLTAASGNKSGSLHDSNPHAHPKGIYIDPTSLPVLGAASVVVVGFAAYLLAGGRAGGAGSARIS